MQLHQRSTHQTEQLTTTKHQREDRSSLQKQGAILQNRAHESTQRSSWATPGKWGLRASAPNQTPHDHISYARKARETKLAMKPLSRFQEQEGASLEVTSQLSRREYPDPGSPRSEGDSLHGSTYNRIRSCLAQRSGMWLRMLPSHQTRQRKE